MWVPEHIYPWQKQQQQQPQQLQKQQQQEKQHQQQQIWKKKSFSRTYSLIYIKGHRSMLSGGLLSDLNYDIWQRERDLINLKEWYECFKMSRGYVRI